MAIAKKGTRLIRVDDVEYRWIVQPNDEPGLGIVVECAENPAQRMITWVEHGNIISPWLVRKAILHALDRGWKPKQRGQELSFRFEGILVNPKDLTGVPTEDLEVDVEKLTALPIAIEEARSASLKSIEK
jgi:hypothetical protein